MSNPANIPAIGSYAAVRALGAAAPQYATLYVLGKAATDDGGQGIFVWNGSSTATDDGGTILQPTGVSTGRYIREYPAGDINLAWYCGLGDGVTDNASNIQAAINALPATGGRIFVPNGTFVYGSDIRILTNWVSFVGTGVGSILQPKNSAKFYLGQAINNSGVKSGTKILYPYFGNMAFTAQANHSGPILWADYCDNFTIDYNVPISVLSNDGSTRTDGLYLYWVQYPSITGLQTLVNGYGVHIVLSGVSPYNEDHYSFIDCFLYSAKTTYSTGTSYPAGIAIERQTGRPLFTSISQFGCYNVHFGEFMSPDNTTTTCGVLLINETPGSQSRIIQGANFQSCMFENPAWGINGATLCPQDTSIFNFKSCYFLVCRTWCVQGTSQFNGNASFTDCNFNNCVGGKSGIKAYFSGVNTINNVTTFQGDNWAFDKLANKEASGSVQSVVLKSQGTATLLASSSTVTITHGLNAFGTGITPTFVGLTAGYAGSGIAVQGNPGSTTFVAQVSVTSGSNQTIWWQAELIDD